jgi:hypothetical protein
MSLPAHNTSLRFKQLKSEMVTTYRLLGKVLSAFDDLGDRKLAVDDKMESLFEEVPLGVDAESEIALLRSAYTELYDKYVDMLAKGLALGKELGTMAHSVLP